MQYRKLTRMDQLQDMCDLINKETGNPVDTKFIDDYGVEKFAIGNYCLLQNDWPFYFVCLERIISEEGHAEHPFNAPFVSKPYLGGMLQTFLYGIQIGKELAK